MKAVIFDWGGVLIDDPAPGLASYCSQALGVTTKYFSDAQTKHLPEFQKGLITEAEFWQKVCAALNLSTPKVGSLWASAFRSVYSPKSEMFGLAKSLRANGYRVALLSNTEVPAMEYFHEHNYGMFDVLVFSCNELTRKPEKEIYELVLDRLKVKPSEAVLIDDRADYINGANQVGLKTILFKNPVDTIQRLANYAISVGIN